MFLSVSESVRVSVSDFKTKVSASLKALLWYPFFGAESTVGMGLSYWVRHNKVSFDKGLFYTFYYCLVKEYCLFCRGLPYVEV